MTTYVVGQVLADGRKVLEIEDGVPVLSKAPQPAPPAPVPAAPQVATEATPPPQTATTKRKPTPRKPGPKSVNTAAVSEKLRTAGTAPVAAPPKPQVAPNEEDSEAMAKKRKAAKKGKAAKAPKSGPAGQPKYRDLKVALPATRAVGSHQRLTDEQVADLKALRKRDPEGYTWRRLGYIFGTTDTTAQGYCEGKKAPGPKRARKK